VAPFLRQSSIVLWQLSLLVLLLLVSCDGDRPVSQESKETTGVNSRSVTPESSSASARLELPPVTAEMKEDAESRVMGACSRCHAPLLPDTLPRAAWEKVVLSMADTVGEWGQPAATPEELAIALYWYEREAPEQLQFTRHLPETELLFETIDRTPRGLESERIPAISDLLLLEDSDGEGRGILASELRSRRLMILPHGNPLDTPLLPFLPTVDFRYPSALRHCDLDSEGGREILVASIGGMNPGNEVRGGAWVASARKGRWNAQQVGGKLARCCDLQGGDLDGDGDPDLVACAFGFRGPGQLVWMRLEEGEYQTIELDKRDGFVAVEVEDVDSDGDLDILALLSQQHEMVLQFTNDGSGNFSPQSLLNWPHAAWGSSGMDLVDLDGDGDRDLLLVNGDTLDDNTPKPIHGVRWLERVGSSFTTLHEILTLPGCERAAVGDLDGDGDLDVVGAAFLPQLDPATWKNWDSVVWAENLGDARKWQVRVLEVGNPVHSAVLLDDVDQDGATDIVLGNYVWLRADQSPTARRDYITVLRQLR